MILIQKFLCFNNFILWRLKKEKQKFYSLFSIFNKKNNYFTLSSQLFQSDESSDKSLDENLNTKKVFNGTLPTEKELQDQISRGEDPYLTFIDQAVKRAKYLLEEDPTFYTEKHHVLPRHANGSDDLSNLVKLTYDDHAIAHYIRWFVYKNENDKIAYQVMMGQDLDLRRERARLGGLAGGPKAQAQHKEQNTGWFNSDGQRARGKKGAAVNCVQGTGGFDPTNLQKANEALETAKAENPEKYEIQNRKNLTQGLQTQREKGINIGDPLSQRRKSVEYHGIKLNGVRYSCNTDDRTHICDTTLEYYLLYAPKTR